MVEMSLASSSGSRSCFLKLLRRFYCQNTLYTVICCVSSSEKVLPRGRLTPPSLLCGLLVVLDLFALTEVHQVLQL